MLLKKTLQRTNGKTARGDKKVCHIIIYFYFYFYFLRERVWLIMWERSGSVCGGKCPLGSVSHIHVSWVCERVQSCLCGHVILSVSYLPLFSAKSKCPFQVFFKFSFLPLSKLIYISHAHAWLFCPSILLLFFWRALRRHFYVYFTGR